MLVVKQLSSLAKVFPDKIYGKATKQVTSLKGQSVSFQIAYKGQGEYSLKVKSSLKKHLQIQKIGYVPSAMPAYPQCDDGNYERREPGLFPDPLFPFRGKIKAEKTYNALFITVNVPSDFEAGKHVIDLIFKNGSEEVCASFAVKVENIVFEKKDIIFTEWFHTDCIADFHKVEVYSDKHWELIKKYMKMASEHGISTILVPVLTPPLDTYEGGERTTTQLVKINYENGKYSFDFELVRKFISTATECGINRFEINHMFTQWGAKNAPKVIATVDGEKKRIFGWETCATSDEYKEFLGALIPALISFLKEMGINNDRVFFHVSDEPSQSCFEEYKGASAILRPLIKGYKLIDAMSHIEFYKQGLVEIAVCSINDIEPFLEEGVPELWGYYCCAQNKEVSNRFFSMSSARNRIIGAQIYKFGLSGFLHWGYNFYNSQFSRKKINPYKVTDAGGAFPSGDAFSVYPYRNGVIPALRLKIFKEALDDVSLLYMLESKIGREKVTTLVDRVAGMNMTFKVYPRNEEFFEVLKRDAIKELKRNS